ncbi:hypothetical protein M2244_001147 [Rhodoferax antarcticus]|nr:hypothetical protein [Rhodoferax antarcticus]
MKAKWRKSGGCAMKDRVFIWGDFASCLKERLGNLECEPETRMGGAVGAKDRTRVSDQGSGDVKGHASDAGRPERVGVAHGAAGPDPISDEACGARLLHGGTRRWNCTRRGLVSRWIPSQDSNSRTARACRVACGRGAVTMTALYADNRKNVLARSYGTAHNKVHKLAKPRYNMYAANR